jgi:hypothetical protein
MDYWDTQLCATFWIIGTLIFVQFSGLLRRVHMCNLLDCWDAYLCAIYLNVGRLISACKNLCIIRTLCYLGGIRSGIAPLFISVPYESWFNADTVRFLLKLINTLY